MSTTANELREEVRRRYAESARAVTEGTAGCGCGSGSCCEGGDAADFGAALYDAEQRGELPDAAALASLGCGNPIAVADLHEGETVLDLGSGGGIDVILSAKRVGPAGRAFGLDMTDEMLALARKNAADAEVTNAIFLKGVIEDVPLPAASVDVVISNCVINLSTDKAAVLTEIGRVLKPGGRIGVSDVVAEDRLTPEERAERALTFLRAGYVGEKTGPPSTDPELMKLFFDSVRLAVDSSQEPITLQWDFADAEPWHLRVDNGASSVEQGRLETPDVTFRCRFEDWVDVAAGREDPRLAMLRGRIRPRGSVRSLWRMRNLFAR